MAVLSAADLYRRGGVIPAPVRAVRWVPAALALALLLGIVGTAVAGVRMNERLVELRSLNLAHLTVTVGAAPGLEVSITGVLLCALAIAASIKWPLTGGPPEQGVLSATAGATVPVVAVANVAAGSSQPNPLVHTLK